MRRKEGGGSGHWTRVIGIQAGQAYIQELAVRLCMLLLCAPLFREVRLSVGWRGNASWRERG